MEDRQLLFFPKGNKITITIRGSDFKPGEVAPIPILKLWEGRIKLSPIPFAISIDVKNGHDAGDT